MEPSSASLGDLAATTKRLGRRLVAQGENRFELLLVELQEERERLLHALLLALGAAVFGLLACIALTVMVILLLWERGHLIALGVLVLLYGGVGTFLYIRLGHLLRDWKTLPATFEQFRKDRACIEHALQ